MPNTAEIEAGQSDKGDNDILLGVLDIVEQDPVVTQRSVARELGIALGLANAYLKRCIRKGLIKVSQAPSRRYAYYLTPQGFAEKSRLTASYLAHSFSFFRQARDHCAVVFLAASARNQRRLALVGKGDLAEVASLVAREHPVEICGTIAATRDRSRLAAAIEELGTVDAVVITALVESREVFETATQLLGADRVHAPALLRVRTPVTAGAKR